MDDGDGVGNEACVCIFHKAHGGQARTVLINARARVTVCVLDPRTQQHHTILNMTRFRPDSTHTDAPRAAAAAFVLDGERDGTRFGVLSI